MFKINCYVLLILFIALCESLIAQEVVLSAGGNNSVDELQVSWSLGEILSEEYSQSETILTQGFQQYYYEVASVIRKNNLKENILLFPNPVEEILNIQIDNQDDTEFRLQVLDDRGKIISDQLSEIHNGYLILDFSGYQAGIYFLRISTTNSELTDTYKIIKSFH